MDLESFFFDVEPLNALNLRIQPAEEIWSFTELPRLDMGPETATCRFNTILAPLLGG
jgi:hypothetical protein